MPNPARILHRPPEQKLDLRVEAAQLVVGPALDRVEQVRIDTKQKRASVGHRYW